MNGTNYKLGRIVPRPAGFEPDIVCCDARFIYRVDTRSGVCKRASIDGSDPSVWFFELLEDAPATAQDITPKPSGRVAGAFKFTFRTAFTVTVMMAAYVFFAPIYPEVSYQLQQTTAPAQASGFNEPIAKQSTLHIPSIGVTTPIVEGDTLDVLDQEDGVWHQTGTLENNFVIAGHRFRYLPPNTTTFYHLGKLQPGDDIYVDHKGKRHHYRMAEKMVVPQTRVDLIAPTDVERLTIYTCYDKGETERIVVVAEPVE